MNYAGERQRCVVDGRHDGYVCLRWGGPPLDDHTRVLVDFDDGVTAWYFEHEVGGVVDPPEQHPYRESLTVKPRSAVMT